MPPENIRQRIIQQKQDADRLHSQLNAAVRMQSRISEKNSRRCAAKSGLPVNNGRASLQRAGNGGTNGK